MSLSPQDLKQLFRRLLLIRRFEEEAFRLAVAGKFANYHGGMGQEAIPVGACYGLKPTDNTMITHRGLGVLLTRGVPVGEIFAGLYAKESCPTRGRHPIFHMAAPELGILAGTTMVGSVIPLATGAALAARIQGKSDVTISFFGDGSVNRGDFHEGINLGAVRKLPIVYFCENNFYAKSMPLEASTAGGNIVSRAQGYGLPSEVVDGNDVVAVYEATQRAVARARAGDGPTFIECLTYRWTPHSTAGDREFSRTDEELAGWKAKCPVMRLRKQLIAAGHASAQELDAVDLDIQREVAEGVEFAEAAPYAAPGVALENVYL